LFLSVFALNQPRNPLRINVGFLKNLPIGASRDIHFEFPVIQLVELEFTNFKGVVNLSRTPQGLLAQCDFSADVSADCARCLESFDQSLTTSFSELFAFSTKAMDESGLVVPEDGNIDFEPIVYEYLLLEMPISPVCREDCKGLCKICGMNLNEESPALHTHEEEDR
jgi:uncharacterized protein